MPNHITNVLAAPAEVIEAFTTLTDDGERQVDFNTVMPAPSDDDPMFTATKTDFGNGMVGYGFDGFSPLDWHRQNWGTKWNAYSQSFDSPEQVSFETAWAHPYPVLRALSKKFPTAVLEVKYADEDIGYNFGHYYMIDGVASNVVLVDEGSDEARDWSCTLRYGRTYAELYED